MLVLKDVKKTYHAKSGEVGALNGINLELPATGMVFITGKSGCGKTTLLNVIGGLDGIDQGDISVLGKSFSQFTAEDYDNYRNTFIGFIFQEYNLLSEYTVQKNIEIAMELQGSIVDQEKLNSLLETVDILDLKDRKPNELSGGQRQRVAIARALVKEPRIIMADEPTGALDSATGEQVLDILKKLSKDKLVIVVSHDVEFAERYADRLIRLVDGKIVEDNVVLEQELKENVSESENSLLVREGSDLTQPEKDAVAKAIKERKKIEIIKKLSFREKRPTGKVKTDVLEKVNFLKSKMKFKSAFSMGIKSLGVKPLRLIFTIFLSAIAFAVFGLFDTIANFNTASVINNELRNSSSSTIVVNGKYVIDNENGDYYNLKLSEEFRKELQKSTGFAVKGVYDYEDNINGYITSTNPILEISDSGISIGKNYYTTYFTGITEFGEDEISPDGKLGNFDYKVVSGKYPTINRVQQETQGNAYCYEVAISTYMAESIIYYLDGGTLLNKNGLSCEITQPSDLLEKIITVKGRKYEIVGLIDCGEIPQKYEQLKTTSASNVTTASLADAFSTFINSGAYKYLFVSGGYLEDIRALTNDATIYFSGDSTWKTRLGQNSYSTYKYFYSSNVLNQDNVLFFSNEYNTSLKDDEVLINIDNFKTLYHQQLSVWKDAEIDHRTPAGILEDLQSKAFNVKEKQDKLHALLSAICQNDPDNRIKTVTLNRKSEVTDNVTTKENLKVVGIYYGIDTERSIDSRTFRFMMNDNLMSELGIFNMQGEYSKLLINPNGGTGGTKTIANYMSQKSGLTFNWYGNTALTTIADNEQMIRQSADLFLYASIVLALFSIFMFFNYIVTSIVNKRQSVGVLRCLGSNGKNILLIFTIESVIIALINGLLATTFTAVGCMLINLYIINVMNIPVSFAIFGVRQFLIILGVSIVTAVLSSLFPIMKISKEKPVDLIRKP